MTIPRLGQKQFVQKNFNDEIRIKSGYQINSEFLCILIPMILTMKSAHALTADFILKTRKE